MADTAAGALAAARAALQAQPFSRLVGAELTAYAEDTVELRIPTAPELRPELRQQHGFVHGGVLSYAADNALTFAGGAALGPAVVTSEYKINYLRPATGIAIVARAGVIHAGRRQAVCQCRIHDVQPDGSEKLCAVAQGTITRMGGAQD